MEQMNYPRLHVLEYEQEMKWESVMEEVREICRDVRRTEHKMNYKMPSYFQYVRNG